METAFSHVYNHSYKKIFTLTFFVVFILLIFISLTVFYISFQSNVAMLSDYNLQNASFIKENLNDQFEQVKLLTDQLYLNADIHKILSTPNNADDNTTAFKNYFYAQDYALQVLTCQVDLLDFNGNIYTRYNSAALAKRYLSPNELYDSAIYQQVLSLGGQILWIGGEQISKDASHLLVAARLVKNANTNERLGVVFVSFLKKDISAKLSNYTPDASTLTLVNSQGEIVLSKVPNSVPSKDPTSTPIIDTQRIQSATAPSYWIDTNFYDIFSKGQLSSYLYDDTSDWYIVQTMEIPNFGLFIINTKETILILVISCLFAASLTLYLYRKTYRPIFTLVQSMKSLETLDFTIPELDTTRDDEIGYLNNTYILMLKELKLLFDNFRQAQTAQKNAEMKALQMQISPHFLYNTLTTARYLIDMDQKKTASQMIISLIKLLKISLNPQKEMLTIAEEIEYLTNYKIIQQKRYEQFELFFHVAENCNQLKIPRLLIQPLVENSLFHGLKNGVYAGEIHISIKTAQSFLCVCVQDSGCGFPPNFSLSTQNENPEQHGTNIGLHNINNRLLLRYGLQSGLQFENTASGGAKVSFKIPLQEV